METLVRGHWKNIATADAENAGDGTISAVVAIAAAPTEIWTLVCTAAVGDAGTFSVTGSVSGAKADLTVASAYDNSIIALTVADGDADWEVDDIIIIDVIREVTYASTSAPSGSRKIDTLEASFTGDVTSFIYTVVGSLNTTNEYVIESAKTLSGGELTAKGTLYAPTNKFSVSRVTVNALTILVTTEAEFQVALATI